MTLRLATLIPALPDDLVHLVLDYAPGIAIKLPSQERIHVVRRLTGFTLSDERASLVLEQRDVNNRDFDDLTLAADDLAWRAALLVAFSPRAFDALVRTGEFQVPLVWVHIESFVERALLHGEDQGLALAQHLEHMGTKADILCQTEFFDVLASRITHSPTIQYLLRRLLDAHDASFEVRKQHLIAVATRSVRPAIRSETSPLALLVYQLGSPWVIVDSFA
jgi:hypothetical protein